MGSPIRTIIVDDEAPARQRIRSLAREALDIAIVAECESGTEAVSQIRELKPALLFLDVQMPEMDGFGVLQALAPEDRPAGTIFVTAHDTYAVRAFDVSAVDYLLKPYSAQRFHAALQRVRDRLDSTRAGDPRIDRLLQALQDRVPAKARLALRSHEGVQMVDVDEIDWLQGDGNYTLLHLGRNSLRIRETVSSLEERLAAHGFVRVHRSIIVNGSRIFRIEPWGSGEYVIVLRDGTKIQSSRTYSERLRAFFS
ncbi:MAG: LytTR family DNA-binding domain-containing protein [Candidatus Baltobacteraceae bacterium]